MPRLLLGPMLRHVAETTATVWVEVDAPAEVEVLGHRARSFEVAGHHYALVVVEGLAPGTTTPYGVALDGEPAWPQPGDPYPPPVVRTLGGPEELRIAWGSCRVSLPEHEPYTLPKDAWDGGRGVDAVHALAVGLQHAGDDALPHLLLWLGDQVYADEVPPDVRDAIAARDVDRRGAPPDHVCDYEEYAWLYRDSWSEPSIRWLLSTVPSAMIFDDHDVHDDWNTSHDWREAIRREPWWHERIVGGLVSYWVHQHLGNLGPDALAEDPVWRVLQRAGADGDRDVTAVLRDLAETVDRDARAFRWSFVRDLGATRLLAVDSRAARDLDPGRRRMVDDEEWAWIRERAAGDFDHLIVATSIPVFLGHGLHWLEAADEAIAQGAWGRLPARGAEWLRQAADLEHWSAFQASFRQMAELLVDVAAGALGRPPGSVLVLSGDVHHAYVAEVAPPRAAGARSPIVQAVCSPYRNPLGPRERRAIRTSQGRLAWAVARTLGRLAGVADPPVGWRITHGPWFDNQVAGLEVRGREATLRLTRSTDAPALEEVLAVRIASPLPRTAAAGTAEPAPGW